MALQLRDSSPLSSVPFSTCSYTYDVFLSFRGEDTRHGFTGHLYKYLLEKGIYTFIDDNELPRGEEISEALLRAIDESKLSLIVFSENYASSKWCLDELVHILGRRRSKKQLVCPIFYKVDPSDVGNQKGKFGEAFAKHEDDRVLRWRAALKEAAKLSGWHFSDNGYESKFIEGIVEEISAKVKKETPLDVAKSPVGIESRVRAMLGLLDLGGSDIRMVGIWGSGGIGKPTIAKAFYNAIVNKFEHSCFVANVRKLSDPHEGLVNLQNQILGAEGLKVTNADQGITLLGERLRNKRMLLVLDDVDQLDQLEKLAGRLDWFGSGSRIIITTRHKDLLLSHELSESQIYKVPVLGSDEARELFCAYALKNEKTCLNLDEDEKRAVNAIVEYAGGLPLALKVLGSHLCTTPIHQWQGFLERHKRSPLQGIQKILRISYDSLEDEEKEIFLDIAFFFKGRETEYVTASLLGCGYSDPAYSIEVLKKKALLEIGAWWEYGIIFMHDLVEEMGKKIVHEESPKEPGGRSRLWHHSDVLQVLTENTRTRNITCIMVKMPTKDEIKLSRKCFKKMENLKIFINVNGRFVGKIDHYPNQLRVLDWPQCPLEFLPSNFDTKKLISRLGKTFKSMQNLTSLNLMECQFLEQIPDVSGSPNLEYLNLQDCPNLLEIHPSVGSLEKLVGLYLNGCTKLVKLPEKVKWRSLRNLDLFGCRSLESFPEIVGEMKHFTSFSLYGTAIEALPSSIRNLINLEMLDLQFCKNLTDLPCSIYELQELTTVNLMGCSNLVTFPNKVDSEVVPTCSKASHDDFHSLSGSTSMDNSVLPWLRTFNANRSNLSNIDFMASLGWASSLSELDLSHTPIAVLPEWIKEFVNLRELNLFGCRSLVVIPELPSRIERLDVGDCVSLERISKLSNILERKESQMIPRLNLSNCWRLYQNLVDEMANEEDDEVLADILFYRLLSSQQFKFRVVFPVPRSEVPNWFSCQMDFMGHDGGFEFWIETLPNFKWDNNNTGLALCAIADPQPPYTLPNFKWDNNNTGLALCAIADPQPPYIADFYFTVFIYINEVLVLPSNDCNHVSLGNLWVHYVPLHEMWRFGYMRPLPPFTCRVSILQRVVGSIKSCGVRLVMPPNEDVCMQLIRAEKLTSKLSDDEEEGNWETYRRPKERTD